MVSIVTYTGDGSTTDYSIPFPYLDREHVVVELDDLVTTNFSFLSDTSIRLTAAPAAQTRVVVKRSTPVAPLVDFTDGSTLFEADLDLADQQSRYLGEEARDRSDTALTTINNNLADVVTVAGIASDVSTVAAVDGDVTTVATNLNGIDSIGTVAGIDTEVTTVAGISNDVTTVSANDSNVTTTATNIANVNTVAGINTDVTTVSGISGDVTTVANNDANVTTVASNDANVTTVAGISSDVTTVANNDANVTAVAGNASDISTVAGINTAVSSVATNNANVTTAATNIANVNTVAGNITNVNNVGAIDDDVTTVAGISGNVSTVAGISTDVSTVATNNTNVTAVGGSIGNVNTAAGSINNINTVASDITNVNTAAADIDNINTTATSIAAINTVATAVTDVSTVSGDIASVITAANDLNEAVSEIETVAASITNVDTVGASIADVNTVAGISSDVSTVSANDANVTTVAGIDANITTVAGISGDVTTVSGISSDVTTVANDTTDIGTVASNISNVNSVSGSINNINTVATNINNVNDFFDAYRVGSNDPTTSLDTGDLFYNTTSGTLKVYTGSGWEQGVTAGSGFLPLTGGTLTGNLVFSGTETVDGRDVSVDGAKLDTIEAGANVTDTANVTAAGALMDSEVTNLNQVKSFDSSDYATAAQGTKADAALPKAGGTMTGAITFAAGQTFDGRDVSADGAKLDGIEANANRITNNNQLTNGAGYITINEVPANDSITQGNSSVSVVDSGVGEVVVNIDGTDVSEITSNHIKVPVGTTAQRDVNASEGSLRYNTTTGFFETLTAAGWGSISPPPRVTSISPASFSGNAGQTFTINGSFFDSGSSVSFVGKDGTQYAASSVTFVSPTQLNAVNATALPVSNEPFKAKVTSSSGLSSEGGSIDAGSVPSWTTPAGNLGSSTWGTNVNTSVVASDAETSITGYTLTSGSLPTGLSLNTTTGAITGTSPEQASTLYTFDIEAEDTAGNTNSRQFSYQINNAAPVWSSPAANSTQTVNKLSSFSLSLSASDPEGRPVSYSLAAGSSLPAGLALNGNVISGTPSTAGNVNTTIIASDGYAAANRSFYINVLGQFQFSTYFRANRNNQSVRTIYRTVLNDSGYISSIGGVRYTFTGDHSMSNQYNPVQSDRYYMPIQTTDDGDNDQWVSSNGPSTGYTTTNKHWSGFTGRTSTTKIWDNHFIDVDGFRYWATGSSVGQITYAYVDTQEALSNVYNASLATKLATDLQNGGFTIPSAYFV